jgi:predicted flap endonuclease-1-like 5' DNA nuclease
LAIFHDFAANCTKLTLSDVITLFGKNGRFPQPAIPTPQADDLQRVKGIGPVFDGRLQENGIHSIAQLAALSAEKLADLLEIGENRAEAILADAAQA